MKLIEHRKKLGLTQQNVADSIGVGRVSITRIELGARRASPNVARKLGVFYGIPKADWWDVFYPERED